MTKTASHTRACSRVLLQMFWQQMAAINNSKTSRWLEFFRHEYRSISSLDSRPWWGEVLLHPFFASVFWCCQWTSSTSFSSWSPRQEFDASMCQQPALWICVAPKPALCLRRRKEMFMVSPRRLQSNQCNHIPGCVSAVDPKVPCVGWHAAFLLIPF